MFIKGRTGPPLLVYPILWTGKDPYLKFRIFKIISKKVVRHRYGNPIYPFHDENHCNWSKNPRV